MPATLQASPTITPVAVTVVLEAASGVASTTLVLTAPAILVFETASGIASATLDLTAPTVSVEPIQILTGPMVSA